MQSKTSFFNKTIFLKSLIRFAPAWSAYGMLLMLGLAMTYLDGGEEFWFASRMSELISLMAPVNMLYALVCATLLFGDLYKSRMCFALHAMPVRREGLLLTSLAAGILCSLIPTALMALVSVPMLAGTCVENAWLIAQQWFVGVNLEFICFYGIAIFCVFCVANRGALAAVYAAVNGGAYALYVMIELLYAPMLYGVVPGRTWMYRLTPVVHLMNHEYITVENYQNLLEQFQGREEEMVASFWITEAYPNLLFWACVGLLFALAGLVLYKMRNLECAGNAMAFRRMGPLFLIAASIAGGVVGILGRTFFGRVSPTDITAYIFLFSGLTVGWFVGRMLLERTTQVFAPRNWLGLLGVTAAMCVSLFLTHIDILGLEDWSPEPEEVACVRMGIFSNETVELTEPEDIEKMIQLHKMVLEDKVPCFGAFSAEAVEKGDFSEEAGRVGWTADKSVSRVPYRYSTYLWMEFTLRDGRIVTRNYYAWADRGEGDIMAEYLSRWDVVSQEFNGSLEKLDKALARNPKLKVTSLHVEGLPESLIQEQLSPAMLRTLVAAAKAVCQERNLAQHPYFHDGYFYREGQESAIQALSISFSYQDGDMAESGWLSIYPDSRHCLNWLRYNDLLFWQIGEENLSFG